MISFWKDVCILIGILPIVRPKFIKPERLRFLTEQEVEENRRNTEKLFELI